MLRLPVNEGWYNLIKDETIKVDYREIKPFWTQRLENKEYDVVEFYHRFKKDIQPIRYKILRIFKGYVNWHSDLFYLIEFGKRID